MSTTGQLQLGLTEVYAPGTNTVIGYAYTEEHGAGQLQRWLLFCNPRNALEVRPPSPTARLTAGSLAEWRSAVAKHWHSGCLYVWAQADVYTYGATYGNDDTLWTWTQIPPASQMPAPTYPDVDAASAQLDPDCSTLQVTQDGRRGLVFTTVGDTRETIETNVTATVEYWLLSDLYEPAGESKSASIVSDGRSAMCSAVTADRGESLQRFINLANESWTPGSRFAITGCIRYTGESVPANP